MYGRRDRGEVLYLEKYGAFSRVKSVKKDGDKFKTRGSTGLNEMGRIKNKMQRQAQS